MAHPLLRQLDSKELVVCDENLTMEVHRDTGAILGAQGEIYIARGQVVELVSKAAV